MFYFYRNPTVVIDYYLKHVLMRHNIGPKSCILIEKPFFYAEKALNKWQFTFVTPMVGDATNNGLPLLWRIY